MREKQRFLHRLGVYYDVHRFRTPPMNEDMVRAAEQQGRVRYAAAHLAGVNGSAADASIEVEMVESGSNKSVRGAFDYVLNCTGLDHASAWRANPFLGSMLDQGLLRSHDTGIGFDVGPNCEALDAEGNAQRTLRVIGPPTAGAFGDPLGAFFIAWQVRRVLPDVLHALEATSVP